MNRVIWQIYLPAVLMAILIFCLSSIPTLKGPDFGFHIQDKVYHFLEYGLFGWLLCRVAGRLIKRKGIGLILAVTAGLLFALSDEWHQSMVPGREGNLDDVIADAAGLIVSATVFWALNRKSLNQSA